MIQITCKGNSASCTRTERLTSGMVGLQCEFVFDSAWDGLAKTAVFLAGNEQRDVLLTGAICKVPWEVMRKPGYQLVIGVYGSSADGTLVIPTCYAMCGSIGPGADPSGEESTDPTLPVWGQLQGMIGNLNDLQTASKDTLVDAINEAAQSGGGAVMATAEPAEDDIPKVYWTGALPTSKTEGDIQGTIRYKSKTADFQYPATLKVQGSSSANYAKKNFTLKVYSDSTYQGKVKLAFRDWGKLNKFVLKAHWIDHSHVRNVGTAKIWGKIVEARSDYASLPEELRNAPNNGATDGFSIKFFANGVYQGLYEWIVPKDKLFGQDSNIATHSIMNSELNNQPTCAFATTSPTISGNWSEELKDSMSGEISSSFARFIIFVAGSTDEEFVANAENYFDVQSVIDFDIFARVFCIVDNLCRNQIFFTYDGAKWYEGVWDVDAILGLPPTVRGFFAYDTEFQTGYIAYKDYGVTNLLYQRVENLFLERFKARYAELRSGVLSVDSIIDVYERLTDTITNYDGLLEEDYATTTGGGAFTGIPYTAENNIQQIRNFVAQRTAYMDEVIENMTGESGGESGTVACTGISLSASTLTFDGEGSQTLTATVTPDGCTDEVVWSTNSSAVATVSGGVVTAVGNGDAIITATCGGYSATCSVNVSRIAGGGDVNILDGVAWNSGYINTSGVINSSTLDAYTDAFDVSAYQGKELVVVIYREEDLTPNNSRLNFYDSDGMFISYNGNTVKNAYICATVPDNAVSARLTCNTTKGFSGVEMLVVSGQNLNDTATAESGYYQAETGVVVPDATTSYLYKCNCFAAFAGENYLFQNTTATLYFDSAMARISNEANPGTMQELIMYQTPESCAYIGINYKVENESSVSVYRCVGIGELAYTA